MSKSSRIEELRRALLHFDRTRWRVQGPRYQVLLDDRVVATVAFLPAGPYPLWSLRPMPHGAPLGVFYARHQQDPLGDLARALDPRWITIAAHIDHLAAYTAMRAGIDCGYLDVVQGIVVQTDPSGRVVTPVRSVPFPHPDQAKILARVSWYEDDLQAWVAGFSQKRPLLLGASLHTFLGQRLFAKTRLDGLIKAVEANDSSIE